MQVEERKTHGWDLMKYLVKVELGLAVVDRLEGGSCM